MRRADARRLDAETLSLAYGRGLLHTHLDRGPGGAGQTRDTPGSLCQGPS